MATECKKCNEMVSVSLFAHKYIPIQSIRTVAAKTVATVAAGLKLFGETPPLL